MGTFNNIGKFIAKRYKAIIVFWIIILAIAIPFAPSVMEAVEYNMLAMAPEDMESMRAQEYIDANFNISMDGFSTIIVFKGEGQNSVLGQELKEAIFNISSDISGREEMPNNTVISIYTPLLDNYTDIVVSGIVDVNRLANGTAMLIFGMPSMYPMLWNITLESGLMFYGCGDAFALNWIAIHDIDPDANTTEVDSLAYEATWDEIELILDIANVSAEFQDLFWIWYEDFSAAWNSTSGDPVLVDNPLEREEHAINSAFPGFWEDARQYFEDIGLEDLWPIAGEIFNRTVEMLDPLDFVDPYRVNAVCHTVVNDIIQPYLVQIPLDLRAPIEDFIHGFQQKWDDNTTASISSNWTLHLIPNMTQERQFVEELVPPLVDALPKAGAEVVEAVYALGWDQWSNSTAFNDTVILLTHETLGDVDDDLILEIIGLGLNVTDQQIREMSIELVLDTSLVDYPIPIPEGILKMIVNVPSNDTMLMTITYDKLPDGTYLDGSQYIPQVREIIRQRISSLSGIEVLVSGIDGITYDIETSSMEDMEKIDPVSIVLVIILIGLFFRSLVSSIIPPSIIGMALIIALVGIFLLATYVMEVTNYVLVLVMVTMLGAGCDYCIFILSRYREERVLGKEKKEAVIEAVTWAGESITTSGFTVMIGFGVLSVCSFSMVSSIGISLAMGIFIALMFALFFLPSLIMLLGDRVFWPTTIEYVRERKKDPSKAGRMSRLSHRYFEHTARTSIKYAKILVVAAIIISLPAIYVVTNLDTSYDMIGTMPNSESKTGVNDIVDGFGGGMISPVFIAIEFDSRIYNGTGEMTDRDDLQNISDEVLELNLSQVFDLRYFPIIEDMCDDISTMGNIREVTSPTRPYGDTIDYLNFDNYTILEQAEFLLMMQKDMSRNGSGVMIQVTMEDQPYSEESIGTVTGLRELIAQEVEERPELVAAYLSGGTALMYDISMLVSGEFNLMEMLAILLIFVILLIVLGSVFTPIRSIVTILTSVIWTLALTAIVFEYVLDDQLLWLMPIVLIVVCLGLGMDYDIFLTTRIREEVHKGKPMKEAIVDSVKATGGIITICGLIMAGAFGTMTLSGSVMLQEFGFALAFAILLDATVVRMYLVPAIMSLMGRWNWWAPGKLQRTRTSHLEEVEEE
ncbi:MAG: MMPL family transporter [Methanomassiliicoccales archaeon]|nr:MMPL family transporter [Methanomassiliicoccales archaeon]NYT14685.1 MMPL family transporter [Methanomassiliicoccales archaeon]